MKPAGAAQYPECKKHTSGRQHGQEVSAASQTPRAHLLGLRPVLPNRFHGLRQQWRRKGQETFYSLADFIAPLGAVDAEGRPREDFVGAFVVTAGLGADELVCAERPRDLWAVGQHYTDFRPTSDGEMTELLAASPWLGPPGA